MDNSALEQVALAPIFFTLLSQKLIDKLLFFATLFSVSGENYSPKTNECPRELRRKADFAYLDFLYNSL